MIYCNYQRLEVFACYWRLRLSVAGPPLHPTYRLISKMQYLSVAPTPLSHHDPFTVAHTKVPCEDFFKRLSAACTPVDQFLYVVQEAPCSRLLDSREGVHITGFQQPQSAINPHAMEYPRRRIFYSRLYGRGYLETASPSFRSHTMLAAAFPFQPHPSPLRLWSKPPTS